MIGELTSGRRQHARDAGSTGRSRGRPGSGGSRGPAAVSIRRAPRSGAWLDGFDDRRPRMLSAGSAPRARGPDDASRSSGVFAENLAKRSALKSEFKKSVRRRGRCDARRLLARRRQRIMKPVRLRASTFLPDRSCEKELPLAYRKRSVA